MFRNVAGDIPSEVAPSGLPSRVARVLNLPSTYQPIARPAFCSRKNSTSGSK